MVFGSKARARPWYALKPYARSRSLEHLETWWTIGDFAEVHLSVAGDEVLGMDEPELDVERLDELLDLHRDLLAVLLEFRRRGNEDGVSERDVLGDVEELDLSVVDPRLDGELPAVEMRLHQYRELLVRDGVDFVGGPNDAVAQASCLVEGLEVDGVVRVTVEFEQRLVHPTQKADDVLTIVCFLEDADTNATELCAALHQCLVSEQHRLAEQPRIAQQHGIDGTGPLDCLLVQRYRYIDAFVSESLRDLERPVVESLEVPR